MDEATLYKLEQQATHFQPFEKITFLAQLGIPTKTNKLIKQIFKNLQKELDEMALSEVNECNEEFEIEQMNEIINLEIEHCLQNFEKASTNIKNKLDEIMDIPNNCLVGGNLLEDKSYEQVKLAYLEQGVFMKCLKQELAEYDKIEGVLTQVEKLFEVIENQPDNSVPHEIKKQLMDDINGQSSEFCTNLGKYLKDL